MPEEFHNTPDTENKESSHNGHARIGVYTCYCGGNISDVVNCERAAKVLAKLPGVIVSRTHMAMCSDAGQAMIEADIKEHGVNRVVIGACAPSLHEQTFRGTVSRAGLNPYLYYHVSLREQDSWVHADDKNAATEKAIQLMGAGIAKARLLEPLDSIRLTAEQRALVVGGGIAGLRSALDIARRGIQVTLIEKSPFLGGRMTQLESVFPCGGLARDALHPLIEEVLAHPKITVYTRAELTDISGYVGDYQVQIHQESRGVSDQLTEIEAAMAACPVEVPDEYNYGLTTRKAIYRAYPGSYPATPAIDWENCTLCGECLKVAEQGINLENKPRLIQSRMGAIVVATGFDLYEPRQGEYGYGELPEVISLAKLIRLLALLPQGEALRWNGRTVQNIALIHCVGSRQVESIHEPQSDGQVNPYCSRVCCTATLHLTNELYERFPRMHLFEIYQDIRSYGRGHEEFYTRACEDGVRFLRYHSDEMPEVVPAPEGDSYPVLVRVKDYLTWGEELEVPVDMVVLVTGMMPRQISDIIKLLKISPGKDRFLLEVHPKLRPVETAVPGVMLAGTAQGPMNIQESTAAASAAAAKVACLLGQGHVDLEPYVARVDADKCNGTGACVEVCAYEDAIALKEINVNGKTVHRAVVTPANCSGCGACVSACPNGAIDVQGWTLGQYMAMVEALTAELPDLEVVR
jgi:heterodisulfide reductase subunit A2